MSRWYGNIMNRLEEDRQFIPEITVGTGVTEYGWSDRHPYEVVEVTDQKHVKVRGLGHRAIGGAYSNDWELYSDETNPVLSLVKRGKYWYWSSTLTVDDLPDRKYWYWEPGFSYEGLSDEDKRKVSDLSYLRMGFDIDVVLSKGKQTKLRRARVSFGKADYYYDYSF